jgi:hypothetical protein
VFIYQASRRLLTLNNYCSNTFKWIINLGIGVSFSIEYFELSFGPGQLTPPLKGSCPPSGLHFL